MCCVLVCLFFFFKQKTAYEMRISDWSSDVCSSDLGVLLTVVAFVLVIGPLVFVHELGHYLAGRWFGIKADAFSIGFGREIWGRTDKRGTRWKLGWMPLGGYVKFAGDMNPAGQPSADWLALPSEERARTFQAKRSEEHTSELQSLMRISYAVFCLKKKNKLT